jgi:hypothetical protein
MVALVLVDTKVRSPFLNVDAFLMEATNLRSRGMDSQVGPSYADDARKCFLNLFVRGHEVFCECALARRSWNFCFFHVTEP